MGSDRPVREVRTVGVLHPGEMGAIVAAALRQSGTPVLWCRAGRSSASADRAAAAGLTAVDSLDALVETSDTVLSICPPSAAAETVATVLDRGFRGTYVDANAVGTAQLAEIAATATAAGLPFVDGALFGARRHGDPVRFHLAGPEEPTRAVAALFAPDAGVVPIVLDGPVGAASALKMAHSTFQKAARPLAALAYALAAAHGVSAELLAEAEGMASPLAQPKMIPVAAAKAWRWEPEMHQVAATLEAEGLPPAFALAAAEVLATWEPFRDDRDTSVQTVLDALRGTAS